MASRFVHGVSARESGSAAPDELAASVFCGQKTAADFLQVRRRMENPHAAGQGSRQPLGKIGGDKALQTSLMQGALLGASLGPSADLASVGTEDVAGHRSREAFHSLADLAGPDAARLDLQASQGLGHSLMQHGIALTGPRRSPRCGTGGSQSEGVVARMTHQAPAGPAPADRQGLASWEWGEVADADPWAGPAVDPQHREGMDEVQEGLVQGHLLRAGPWFGVPPELKLIKQIRHAGCGCKKRVTRIDEPPSPCPFLPAATVLRRRLRAISSVVERLLHTQEVAGSNPASRTPLLFPRRELHLPRRPAHIAACNPEAVTFPRRKGRRFFW